jgi:hypothetical protein
VRVFHAAEGLVAHLVAVALEALRHHIGVSGVAKKVGRKSIWAKMSL